MLLAFVPVLFFLMELQLLDGYKLVSRSALIKSIARGAATAFMCLAIHQRLLDSGLVDQQAAGYYVAPITRGNAQGPVRSEPDRATTDRILGRRPDSRFRHWNRFRPD